MKRLPLITHSLYAELLDQCRAEPSWAAPWPLSGGLVKVPVDGRDHWYLQKSRRTSPGKYQQREYLGPADDPKLAARVEAFESAKAGYSSRAEIISTLKSSGVNSPTGKLANLLLGLHESGILARAVLIGTVAFQAYGAMLGVKFGQSAFQTLDVDMTPAKSVAIAVDGETSKPSLLEILKTLDESFRGVPGLEPGAPPVSYINKYKLRVDILMPFTGPENGAIRSAALQSYGFGQRFLDYLIESPVEAVLLVGGGVLTHVPHPARFALHKLIVSQRRNPTEAARRRKDLLQAGQLIEILLEDDPETLSEAHEDLRRRGPSWTRTFEAGLAALGGEGPGPRAREFFRAG